MGEEVSKIEPKIQQNSKNFQSKLAFKMWVQSSYFGNIELFQMTQKPYEYIMKYTHHTSDGGMTLKSLYDYYKSFGPQKGLVDIDDITLTIKKQMCTKMNQLSIFCRYYNFTLLDAIIRKKQINGHFLENDIIYILKNLLSIGKSYHQLKKSSFKKFNIQEIFLTPQGYIKMYLIKVNDQYKRQSLKNQTKNKRQQTSQSFGRYRYHNLMGNPIQYDPLEDLEDIGLVILSLVFLKQTKYYKDYFGDIKYDIVKQQIDDNWQQTDYSRQLKYILLSMLRLQSSCQFNSLKTTDYYSKNTTNVQTKSPFSRTPSKDLNTNNSYISYSTNPHQNRSNYYSTSSKNPRPSQLNSHSFIHNPTDSVRITWNQITQRIYQLQNQKNFQQSFYVRMQQDCKSLSMSRCQSQSFDSKDQILNQITARKKLIPNTIQTFSKKNQKLQL